MGLATILEKRALYHEYASAYSSDFAIVAAVISLVLLPLAKFNINVFEIGLVYILSLLSTAGYLLTARTYKHGNISVTSATYSSMPIFFTVILAFIFLGEKLTIIQYTSILVMIVTTYILLFVNAKGSKSNFDTKNYAYIVIIVSVINGVSAIVLKYLLYSVNPFTALILLQVFSAINFTIYMQVRYGGIRELIKNFKNNKVVLVRQGILTVSYRATYYFAASLVAISLVVPLRNTIYVIITVMSGGIVFKESNIKRKIILSMVLIAAAYFLVA